MISQAELLKRLADLRKLVSGQALRDSGILTTFHQEVTKILQGQESVAVRLEKAIDYCKQFLAEHPNVSKDVVAKVQAFQESLKRYK